MAAHIEAQPAAKAVVNFAPILLEQLDDYAQQIAAHLKDQSKKIKDAVLASLVEPVLPAPGTMAFTDLAKKYLRANRERMIERFPAYHELANVVGTFDEKPFISRYLNEQIWGFGITSVGWLKFRAGQMSASNVCNKKSVIILWRIAANYWASSVS
jgi:alpha-amylase/alpha-mannosidase (GH57 family)